MDQFAFRKYIIGAIFILVSLVYLIRLMQIQIFDKSYQISAEDNTKRVITDYPARGLMFDRNGKLLVYNEPAYDIKVIPRQVKDVDTALLCNLLEITKEDFVKNLKRAKTYSTYKASIFVAQVSAETYGHFMEQEFRFSGFFAQPRTIRRYTEDIAAHVFGYVQEVTPRNLQENDYYKMHDYIGASGLEKFYEEDLRGVKGRKVYMVDVHNQVIGSFENGRFDEEAKVGTNLTLTIDAELQAYAEKLIDGFSGSIIVIEPKTGEILTFVSAPTYKPSLLVGRKRGDNFNIIKADTLKPFYNRCVQAYQYPPGSTFKLINALIGLQEGVLNPKTKYRCHMGFTAGRLHLGCHYHRSPLNLLESIQHSCNAYYCYAFRSIMEDPDYSDIHESFNNWRNHVLSFGFGQKLGIDFPIEENGLIVSSDYYDRLYGYNSWRALTIISLAIGQGELGVTPLQLANEAVIMANRGYYYTPHFVKSIGDGEIDEKYRIPHYTTIDSAYYKLVVDGMELVVNGEAGSTARIAKMKDIVIAGKTGTAQNPHGEDHSIFIAFAPKDNPEIAVSVYLENIGFGSSWAAPMASLIIEKYLTGTVKRTWHENRIINANYQTIHAQKN